MNSKLVSIPKSLQLNYLTRVAAELKEELLDKPQHIKSTSK